MQRILITDKVALTKANKSFGRKYATLAVTAAVLCVSNIVHAATHGDPSTLNQWYSMLGTNDGTAVRNYIGRLTAIVGGWDGVSTVTGEEMNAFKAKGQFITYSKGAFEIIPVTVYENADLNRKAVMALAGDMLNPDGERFRDFNQRNNLSEIKVLGDTEMIARLDKIIKEAAGTEKVQSKVTPATLAAFKDFRSKFGPATVVLGNA